MGPRSPPRRSIRRSYSRSPAPDRRGGDRRHKYRSRSISKSRRPPSPPPLSPRRDGGRRSLSRSESPRFRRRNKDRYSRSRSRSRSSKKYDRYNGKNREKTSPSRCLGVFGLHVNTTQQKIREIFGKYGPIDRIQVIVDAQTRRSRGFCFIYYSHLADAEVARDNCCGLEVDGRRLRVAYSMTERPHEPTPGVYKGLPTKQLRQQYAALRNSNSSDTHRESYRPRRSRSRSHSSRRYRH